MTKSRLTKAALLSLEEAVASRRPEAFAMARTLLGADDQDPFLRAAAVSCLGAVAGEPAERLLLSILAKDRNDAVRAKACSALSQAGSERSLDPLGAAAAKGPEGLRTIAGFAHAVISHRLRRPSRFLKHPEPKELMIPTGPAAAFQSRALAEERRREVLADLEASRLKLGKYASTPVEVPCARGAWAIALHDEIEADGLSGTLRRGPAVLGVVARRSEEHRRWSPARVILGGPLKGDEFYVSIHRGDGVLDLAGRGSLSDRTFELISARRPGAVALSARGYWHGGALVISGISALERLPARAPEACGAPAAPVRPSPARRRP